MRVMMGVLMMILMVSAAEAANLKVGKMADWTVVVADDAIPSEHYAAEEFRLLFKQCTGIELPIVTKPPNDRWNVLIGQGAAGFIGVHADDLGEEGLRVVVRTDNIAITGGRPRGTLYGVYEFFERYFGVRFLTYDHAYIPSNAGKISIPCGEFPYQPPFSFRWPYYKENVDHPEFAARLRVNTTTPDEKLGGNTHQVLISHSLYNLLPVGDYGKSHPEYYALVDGVRKLDIGGGGPEVCSTNPEVIDLVAQAVIRALDADPLQRNISVSQNDNADYCRCENCEAINQREGTPMGSHLFLVNAVAERVERKYPNVKIGTLAYWYTRKAPKKMVPRKNVQIQLCSIECCTLHPINDPKCERNKEFCADLSAWKRICNDIWVWNYNTDFANYNLPFPNLRVIGPNVRFFRDNNVKGLFMQANGNGNSGEMCDLRNYVISRCIWNPTLDSWPLVEEFCRLHYGKAAKPIMEYLNMIHDNAQSAGVHPGCFPGPADVALTPESCAKAMGYFDEALKLADDDTVRARVEKASICAYRAMLEVCVLPKSDNSTCAAAMPKGAKGIVEDYIALCQRHNMTMASEGMLAGTYFEQIRKAME